MSKSESSDVHGAGAGSGWENVARDAADSFGIHANEEAASSMRELLVFGLDDSAYAVPVERVREIVRMRELTRVPRSPAWLLGVVALRGEIVEVVDLRQRLGLGASDPNRSSRIIVLHGETDRVAGVLVDSVREVFRVPEEELKPAQGMEMMSVVEMCRCGGEFVSILDIDRALGLRDV
jgi:purine-binding chemotaxis protein CheW